MAIITTDFIDGSSHSETKKCVSLVPTLLFGKIEEGLGTRQAWTRMITLIILGVC